MLINFADTTNVYNSQFPGDNLHNTLHVSICTVTHWIWLWAVAKTCGSIKTVYCAVCWEQIVCTAVEGLVEKGEGVNMKTKLKFYIL
jgi:hypothetical protein